MNYVVVTPVKDEEPNIGHTLASMAAQTAPPLRWVIVDDGSDDRTAEIVEDFAKSNPFTQLIRRPPGLPRHTGVAVVLAFNAGLENIAQLPFDLVVKLDGDLSFSSDYFETLCRRFEEKPELGIASGVYLESAKSEWKEVRMPSYHAAGASKVVRKRCFEDIGGFIPRRGWDTLDEIRAMAKGWSTTHFRDLQMRHWKPEGSATGMLKTSFMHGEVFYLTGGGPAFFMLKLLSRILHKPFVTGAAAMSMGYANALLRGMPKLVTADEARLYRSLLGARLVQRARSPGSNVR